MNDAQILEWIAEHMTSFRPLFGTATMQYIDDDGITCEIVVQDFNDHLNPNHLEQLRECVLAANKINL